MKSKNIFHHYIFIVLALVAVFVSSCDNYVDIAISPNKLSTEDAFSSDASATSVVLALYSYYNTTSSLPYFSFLGGLSADELQYTGSTAEMQEFAQASVTTTNSTLKNYLWVYPYAVISEANQAISGITNSAAITAATKKQLLGEAKFFRAYYYFNLVNYLGDVPLSLNASVLENAYLARSPKDSVYAQIINDLKDAQSLLPATYTTTLRTRVNQYAADALLARVYLYTKDYANAEAEATKVITATDVTYTMAALSAAFINTSSETILQFATTYGYSFYGSNYRTSSATAVPTYVLYPKFINSFEAGDQRKVSWIDSVTSSGTKYYKINKYKLVTANSTAVGNEYTVILRLAEQYLIRAEARAQLNTNIAGAAADLNTVRTRAGLPNTAATAQASLLAAIASERKVELVGENHRWFDLKRTGTADAVISALKSTWKSTSVLYPVPASEILLNTNLTQNSGY